VARKRNEKSPTTEKFSGHRYIVAWQCGAFALMNDSDECVSNSIVYVFTEHS